MTSRSIEIFAPSASSNSLGRAFSLWTMFRAGGWSAQVVVPDNAEIWEPLAAIEEFRSCLRIGAPTGQPRAILSVKVSERSLAPAAERASLLGVPLLADIDDPDWEEKYGYSRFERSIRTAKRIRHGLGAGLRPTKLKSLLARADLVITSNPELQCIYGGIVVPHVRDHRSFPQPRPHRPNVAELAFVGTPKPYKGIEAIRRLNSRLGTILTVTDSPPVGGALERERWIGATSLDRGLEVLAAADVVVLPQDPRAKRFAGMQLPVKVMDAMLLERPIVAYDTPVLRWALGDAGILVPVGDEQALFESMLELRSPAARRALGSAARCRALAMFTVEAQTPTLMAAVEVAVTRSRRFD
jgi:glycosyltransferase involved in cell wall biosynthesis